MVLESFKFTFFLLFATYALQGQKLLEYAFQSGQVHMDLLTHIDSNIVTLGSDGECAGASVYAFSDKEAIIWKHDINFNGYTVGTDILRLDNNRIGVTGKDQIADDVLGVYGIFFIVFDKSGNKVDELYLINEKFSGDLQPQLFYGQDSNLYLSVFNTIYHIIDDGSQVHIGDSTLTNYPIQFIQSSKDGVIYYSTYNTVYKVSPQEEKRLFTFNSVMKDFKLNEGKLFCLASKAEKKSPLFVYHITEDTIQYLNLDQDLKNIYGFDIDLNKINICGQDKNNFGKILTLDLSGKVINLVTANYPNSWFEKITSFGNKVYCIGQQSIGEYNHTNSYEVNYYFLKGIENFQIEYSEVADIKLNILKVESQVIDSTISPFGVLYKIANKVFYKITNESEKIANTQYVESSILGGFNCLKYFYSNKIGTILLPHESIELQTEALVWGYTLQKNFPIFLSTFAPDHLIDPNPDNNFDIKSGTVSTQNINQIDNYKISPNPASDEIFIKDIAGSSHFELYCFNGKLVAANLLSIEGHINIQHLLPGIYFLHILENSGQRRIFRFVKS